MEEEGITRWGHSSPTCDGVGLIFFSVRSMVLVLYEKLHISEFILYLRTESMVSHPLIKLPLACFNRKACAHPGERPTHNHRVYTIKPHHILRRLFQGAVRGNQWLRLRGIMREVPRKHLKTVRAHFPFTPTKYMVIGRVYKNEWDRNVMAKQGTPNGAPIG